MWNTVKAKSLVKNDDTLIPCLAETLYYHPYGRFFFYYWKYSKIVILDRGFTTTTGDACTVTQDPTSVNVFTKTHSGYSYWTAPAFYGGFTYIAMDHNSNGYSYIFKWDVTMNSGGTSMTTNTLTSIKTSAVNSYFRNLKGMQDVGLFWTYNAKLGYYLTKIDSSTGAEVSTSQKDSTKTWSIWQAPFNNVDDERPVYLASSDAPAKFYKATNVLTEHFSDTTSKYDFFTYPVDFGKYYAMQIRPGTCAQENGGSEDYDKLHINVLSIRDKAHSICVDDSEDIYCGNGKWETYNLEGCDDGNNVNGDGCSSACAIETRWVCVNTVNATSVCTYTACGNTYLDSGEQCDDGNTVAGDGCSATCQIEDCHYCTGVGAASCTKTCENGVYNSNTYLSGTPRAEVCDEGAASDDLGCLNCCTTIQTGYKCSFGQECWLRCGDGVLDTTTTWGNSAEKCDDGNRVSGDGCRADCGLIEAGYECPTPGVACNKICGNGKWESTFTQNSTSGTHFNENCDYSLAGNNLQSAFKDPHSVCCTNCLYDYTRSIRKQLGLTFSYAETTFISQSGTYMKRNVAGQSSGTEIEYCVPVCKSLYTTGKEFKDSWLTAFNSNYNVWYDAMVNETKSGDIDLTKYNPTVSNYYMDPTTRVCFTGKYCYDCLVPKFPGYEVSTYPDTDTAIMKHSRGKLRIIEKTDAQYGFSIVSNQKTEIQFNSASGLADVSIAHVTQGATRQSFGNFYIQNTDISKHGIYALHDVGGTLKFEKVYTTTDSIKAHLGYDRALWWPTKNLLLVRQYDKITWDGYGLNSLSVQVSQSPSTYTPEQQFEPFSTGPISIDGTLNLDAVYVNDMLVLYRESTMDGNNYLTMYSWTPGHFRVENNVQITNANSATSLVSFGLDKGVLIWHKTDKTGKLYKPDFSAAVTITVQITDATKASAWSAAASPDFRLIQSRPSPANPEQGPTVYAFFTNNDLFTVTLDLANSKIILNPVVTLDSRFNLYQPLDIGNIYLANMVVHPCTMPTVDTDIYTSASVRFYKLGTASTVECITLSSTETTFN